MMRPSNGLLRKQTAPAFDAAHARHLNIHTRTGHVPEMRRLQKLLCRGKRASEESKGPYQALGCEADGVVVVDNCDRGGLVQVVVSTLVLPRLMRGDAVPFRRRFGGSRSG